MTTGRNSLQHPDHRSNPAPINQTHSSNQEVVVIYLGTHRTIYRASLPHQSRETSSPTI
jgi:hypothetical protein